MPTDCENNRFTFHFSVFMFIIDMIYVNQRTFFRKSASQQRKSVSFKKYVNNIEQTVAKKQVPDIHLNHRNMWLNSCAYCLKLRVCMDCIAATVNDINR